MAAGWLGVAMPQEYGGAGLGISEACLMLETAAASGACLAGASAIHMNVFSLHPVVVHGIAERKQRGCRRSSRVATKRVSASPSRTSG